MIILLINMCFAQIGVGLMIPIMPQFIREFGVSGSVLGYLLAVMGLTQFFISPLAGRWVDEYGRKNILVTGMVLFSLAQLIFGAATQVWMLYVSRIIAGISIAFTNPAITAYVVDITAEEDRGKRLSHLSAAMTLGIVIGPGVGGLLVEYGVKVPFYTAALVAAISAIVSYFLLSEPFVANKKTGQQERVGERNLFLEFAASLQTPHTTLFLLIFIFTFGIAAVEAVFGIYLDVKYGFSVKDISLLITSCALMGTLIQAVLVEHLVKAFQEVNVIRGSLFLSGVSLCSLLFLKGFWPIFAALLCFFSFVSTLRPCVTALLSRKAAQGEQGFIAGMNASYTSLGLIVGPGVAGKLFDIHMDLPYIFGAAVIFLSLFLYVPGRVKGGTYA